jgi:hypothetical protein
MHRMRDTQLTGSALQGLQYRQQQAGGLFLLI